MSPIPPTSSEALLRHVRVVAEELVGALSRAQSQTDDWADAALTDSLVRGGMENCLRKLAGSNCWGEANRLAANLLWEFAGEWLQTGWLQRRAREKPRGYAGDYELLAKIDRNFTCSHPLGRAFDTFFQQQDAPQAVRNRHQWLCREMVDITKSRSGEPTRWASVGSGPAFDVRAALEDLDILQRSNVRVTLLDLDPAALDFAKSELFDLLPAANVTAVRENLFRLGRLPHKSSVLCGADFISCPGLFDYLGDSDATALLATCWKQLAPGGRMMVFNFAPHHPSQAYMEWVGSWYLTYRSGEDLQRLARQSGIPAGCLTVASESVLTDHALIAEKPIN